MRVVVIGATGNVGTALCRALGRDPDIQSIVGVARRSPRLDMPKVSWLAADIVTDDLEPILHGADAVVHLAWLIQPSRDEASLRRVNVDGSRRVFEAVGASGVSALVYASSVGAYSPGPKDRAVDESWPTEGVRTSFYARHKAEVERMLDRFEAEQDTRVVRLRPALIFSGESATGIRRLFLGPLFPGSALRRHLIPLVPKLDRLRFQAVHSDDVAEAYRLAIRADVRGAFNIAADPVIDPRILGELFEARPVPVPAALLRGAASLSWALRLQPTPAGWVDMGLSVPIMDTSRALRELGWTPRRSGTEALAELIEGLRSGSGFPTPPLDPRTSGRLRAQELRTGIGSAST
jgi:nucleoside-diphosphate-sugar epimerase